MSEYTEEPVPPCQPGCERCAKALRVLGPVGYNNWRSFGGLDEPEPGNTSHERLIAEAALRWRDAKCAGPPACSIWPPERSVYEPSDHADACPVIVAIRALRETLEGWTP